MQGREESLQVNISNITQARGDPQSFAPSAPFSMALVWLLPLLLTSKAY